MYQFDFDVKALITHIALYLGTLKLKKLWNVVKNSGDNGYQKEVAFPREMFQRVNNGKVALNCH